MSAPPTGLVMVTFEPDAGWPARLAAVRRLGLPLVVVDNSPSPAARRHVADTVAAGGGELIANPDNPGIGRALNQGFARLAAGGCSWAIALDQDSEPDPELPARLAASAGAAPGNVAAIGANWTDAVRRTPARHLVRHPWLPGGFRRQEARSDLPEVLCLINSGTLFSLAAWRHLGGFDEQLFLDLVDSDYCLRALEAGLGLRIAAEARLVHHRGAKTPVVRFGRTFYPAHMPLARLRQLCRNRVTLFRRHRGRPLAWHLYEVAYGAKLLADALFLEGRGWAGTRAFLAGTWEGLVAPRAPFRSTIAKS